MVPTTSKYAEYSKPCSIVGVSAYPRKPCKISPSVLSSLRKWAVFQSGAVPKDIQPNCCMFCTAFPSRPAAKMSKSIPITRKKSRKSSLYPRRYTSTHNPSDTSKPSRAPSNNSTPFVLKAKASMNIAVSNPSRPTVVNASKASANPELARLAFAVISFFSERLCFCIQNVIVVSSTTATRYVIVSKIVWKVDPSYS